MELSLSRTFALGSESSIYGNFVPGSENVMELSLPGAKYNGTFAHSQKHVKEKILILLIFFLDDIKTNTSAEFAYRWTVKSF